MSKLKNEPYYKELTEQDALDSGYFEPTHQKINWTEHVNLPCTPINFLKDTDEDNLAVLISTGAFCPLHEGHINIMVSAKNKVEDFGYTVIGGYLSPGHDQYIKEKNPNDWMPIHKRISWINEKISKIDWLSVDPWEGVFAPGSVNFTSVVYRLQKYLKKYYKKNVKIFFVCGDDNSRFYKPFQNTDIGIVIAERPGYTSLIQENGVMYCENDLSISSTDVRKTEHYKNYNTHQDKQIQLRLNKSVINDTIKTKLESYFSKVWTNYIEDQTFDFNNLKYPVINLDSESKHDINLSISRVYDNFGHKLLGYENRPESECLGEQLGKIIDMENKDFYLFDDDIFTGKTMTRVENILKNFNINIKGRISYLSGYSENHDILDARDFIFMYENGGLVSIFDKKLIRLPYMYPFVDPFERSSVNDPLQFSIDMWEISSMYYYRLAPIVIGENENCKWLLKLGFKKEQTLYDVCEYYYELLKKIKNENYN